MKISVKKEMFSKFETEEYIVDLDRVFEGYKEGDIIIYGNPFDCTGKLPLKLELAVRIDGSIIFRAWEWNCTNSYFQTSDCCEPTQAQIDTINGLFSGRIKWEGLKLAIGKSIQDICPIDLSAEETKISKKIFLA